VPHNRRLEPESTEWGREVRVLLSTYDSRGGVEPQVVVPQGADQPYWASRVADLGIGVAHDVQAPTTESLSAALAAALTPGTRARAKAVAGTIRADGATVAAELLLQAISDRS
jgi:vancomycin aglycone glucosyltransferase